MSQRILLIDDEEAIQIIFKASLEFTNGWVVLIASSGVEGMEMAEIEQPDAILLDVMMPDLDGIAVFHQLQSQPLTQQIPIIFLTAQAREAESKQLASLGSGMILKPFEPQLIAHQISTLLNWPSA